jgi:hypothetical protein
MQYYIDENGYFRFKETHVLVHRWAAEQKLGRKLRAGEMVYHRDHNKQNNLPGNLYITNEYHQEIETPRFGWTKRMNGLN